MKRPLILFLYATSFATVSLTVTAEAVAHPEVCQAAYQRIEDVMPPAVKHYSAKTVAKWREWGKTHPNWKPKRKPNKVDTQKEALARFNFACAVEEVPVEITETFPPEPMGDFLPPLAPDVVPEIPSDAFIPLYGMYPPETIYGTDTGGGYPIVYGGFGAPPVGGPGGSVPPPILVPPPVVVPPSIPEPASLALFGTGLLGIVAVYRKRGQS